MKKTIFTLALLAATSLISNATTRTVSNDAAGGAQFSNLQAAYDASSNNDTLLLEGTDAIYGSSVTGRWNKNLVVIGIGFNPQKQNPRRTKFSHFINCCNPSYFAFESGASGSRFYGIEFTFTLKFEESVSNLTFEDCRFDLDVSMGNVSCSNLIWKNCVFHYSNSDDNIGIGFPSSGFISNTLITNCVFDGWIRGNNNPLLAVTIDHCVFLMLSNAPIQDMKHTLIKNCIFMNTTSIQQGTSADNTYLNNMSRLGTFPSGSGNQANTSPGFTTYTNGSLYSTSHDYHRASAVNDGSDGTQIGVHGGLSNFNETGEVLVVPIMRTVIINNTTVAPSGTLNVQIEGGKPNDQ